MLLASRLGWPITCSPLTEGGRAVHGAAAGPQWRSRPAAAWGMLAKHGEGARYPFPGSKALLWSPCLGDNYCHSKPCPGRADEGSFSQGVFLSTILLPMKFLEEVQAIGVEAQRPLPPRGTGRGPFPTVCQC